MKRVAVMKKLAWFFGAMGIVLIFAFVDWFPTIKDLNLLRREQRDGNLKIKNYSVMDALFVFPDAKEKSLFVQNKALLQHALPQVADDDSWLAMALLELDVQIRAERIAHARVFSAHHAPGIDIGTAAPGRPDALADWLSLQDQDIQESFRLAAAPDRNPWYSILPSIASIPRQRLVSRPLLIALAVPLPALFNFINRISRGEARLEIIRLHLEPKTAVSRAWMICRGSYLASEPSAWEVKKVPGTIGDDLLIDPDSPLLWQKVDPSGVGRVEEKELPPADGRVGKR